MFSYVADFLAELRAVGRDRLGREVLHPVLVLQGVTGTLREPQRSGTVVTDPNDTVTLTRLVGRVFPLVRRRDSPPGPIVVGRSAQTDVAIADYSISNRHCSFTLGGKEVQLVDLGSTNGTLVDGKPLASRAPAHLVGGETVVLGRFAFRFFRPAGFLDYLIEQLSGA